MSIQTAQISAEQLSRVYEWGKGHFLDFKSINIKPSKLTKTASAFANADGGELYVGIEDLKNGFHFWQGFSRVEDANGHIQALEQLFPLGTNFRYSFLSTEEHPEFVLFFEFDKTPDIRFASDNIAYLRRE
jgi:ATP-dependent DNA helicase RecG